VGQKKFEVEELVSETSLPYNTISQFSTVHKTDKMAAEGASGMALRLERDTLLVSPLELEQLNCIYHERDKAEVIAKRMEVCIYLGLDEAILLLIYM